MLKYVFLLSSLSLLACAEDNLDDLLSSYQQTSDLSKMTMKDSSSFAEVYTRDDLEKMQIHTLDDFLKIVPGIYAARSSSNILSIAIPSNKNFPLSYTRLYINDHDVSSSSFGSAFQIWGEMPTEYIDHIEIYKATSSMEFGNENAALIIKLYTKNANRDSGSKVRLLADNLGSYDANMYTADILENGISYFAYANSDSIKREQYKTSYNGKEYNIDSNKQGYNLFATLNYKNFNADIASYQKRNDNFLGKGKYNTPENGDLKARHSYIHLSQTFSQDIKVQLSYDNLTYERHYIDQNGLTIATPSSKTIQDYDITFEDNIFSAIIEKKFTTSNNSLLLGGFYKYKGFSSNGDYIDSLTPTTYTSNIANSLNMYSLYAEDNYDIDSSFRVVTSIKGDFFRYDKEVKDQNELLAKIGFIKKVDSFKAKLFYEKGYVPLSFYQIYNPGNTPYKANPNLDTIKTDIATASLNYTSDKLESTLTYVYMKSMGLVEYAYLSANGWINSSNDQVQDYIQLDSTYKFDLDNKIVLNLAYGKNSDDINYSPNFEALLSAFNSYKDFDFYNTLIYKNGYKYTSRSGNLNILPSYELISALKYHYSQDLSFGLRAENILNKSMEQAYKGRLHPKQIQISDRKIWLNMEYTF